MPRAARTAPLLFATLFLHLGCGDEPKGGDEVGGAKTEIVDPGTGAENTEALWPLTVGLRREHTAGVVAVPDRTQKFGRNLYRFQGTSTVRFYEQTDEGVFSAGSINLGALPREVLLVPAKVKVGMKWLSYETTELPSITSVVKSATMTDTIFGPRMVWVIEQTDEVGKATYSTSFAEGRGPIETDGDAATLSIVPLDPEPALASTERLTLTPLNQGLPIFAKFWGTNMSATIDAAGKASVRVGGIVAWYKNTTGLGSWQLAAQTACASTSDGNTLLAGDAWAATGQGTSATNPACPDASGALFQGGALQQIDVGSDGSYTAGHSGLHVNASGVAESFAVTPDQDGLPIWALGHGGPMYSIDARVYGGEIARTWTTAAGPFQRILIDSTAPADDFGFAAMFGDRVVSGAIKGTGITPLELVAGEPGAHLCTKTTPGGREHYLVTTDGVVDRMHIGIDGTVALERYAELDLPAQHELVGVVPFADHLLVLAVRGREGEPHAGLEEPVLGDVLAFSAPLPSESPAAARALLPHNAITAEILGYDLKVCWPKGAGAPSTTGWTLGGKPAQLIVSGASDDCAVLLRDKGEVVMGEGAYAAEGPVPGVGRVAIGLHTPQTYTTVSYGAATQLAQLSSGGFISSALRYGNAADVIGVPAAPAPAGGSGRTADAAGNGIWWPNTAATRLVCGHDLPAAVLTGEISRCILAPSPGIPLTRVGGGGVVWFSDATTAPVIMRPDGTATPIMGLPANAVTAGVTADGTACGVYGIAGARKLFCTKAGAVTDAPISEMQYAFLQAPWAPLGNFFYSITDGTAPMRIDPAALKVETIDASALGTPGGYFQPRYSSDGKLYVSHHDGAAVHLYAVEGTKLTAADPAGYAPYAQMVQDFVITKDLVVGLTMQKEPLSILRFLRK